MGKDTRQETLNTADVISLDRLGRGQRARIKKVGSTGALHQHFLSMGLVSGTEIEFVKKAPSGDPLEFKLRDYELTLREEDAQKIEVELLFADADEGKEKSLPLSTEERDHPGFGESGPFHSKSDGDPLPDDALLSFALVGNPNCGKSTLFNKLTGSNQRVGNFPGVTLERKEGQIKHVANTKIVDLPGIYSMSPYSEEERISRQFIIEEKPTCIINIVDATNIERNLYLTLQLMELNVPMVLALNMMDEVQSNGGTIRINEMEAMLGIPVIPISAVHNEGIKELIDHAIHIAHFQERPSKLDLCDPKQHGGAMHRCLHGIMHLIEKHATENHIPLRFAATKLIEGDKEISKELELSENEQNTIEHIIVQMEETLALDRGSAVADMRYAVIQNIVEKTVIKPQASKEHRRSLRIDKIFTGRFTAIPVFIFIMAAIFILTFSLMGPFFQDLIQAGIDALCDATSLSLEEAGASPALQSFVIDGVFNGVGTVILFFPLIVLMFLFLALLQDTGYISRVAFFMDRALRRIGLSGRSIVPMIMGFGCSVPAIMATRTLPSERDRKLTVMLTPFMSCTTKLTIYGFIAEALFPGHVGLIIVGLYLLGIVVAILVGFIANRTAFRGEAVPFVMELPNYRLPSLKTVGRLVWDRTAEFITKAFSVIFIATLIVWFLSSFSPQLALVLDNPEMSILAMVGGWVAPLFSPLGFGDWRFVAALVGGFLAKETVVSSLSVVFASTEALLSVLSPAAGLAFLVFCLLYTPCVAAVAAIKRELGGKWALGIVIMQCVIAWIVAFGVYFIAFALGV